MAIAIRWAALMVGLSVVAGTATACGGGGASASVPAAPGASLTARVLQAGELGVPGYTASREPVVAQNAADAEASDSCAAERDDSLRVLRASGFQATARRSFEASNGGGISGVWQFATPSGAATWERTVLTQTAKAYPGCVPQGVTRTGYQLRRIQGLPAGTLTHATQSGPDGPGEAWNVVFTDGRFVYVVGVAGHAGQVRAAEVIGAARHQWQRRNG
jgi:hypothetical protein